MSKPFMKEQEKQDCNFNTMEQRFSRREQKGEFLSKAIDITRVTRVAAGGKHMTFRATVVIGDQKGKVGVGTGKGLDVAQAIEKATRAAKKRSFVIPMVNGTIPHQVKAKFGPAEVLLKPQRQGRGLVAGGVIRIICELGGVKDVSAKFLSSTHNKLNNAMVTIEALRKLKQPAVLNHHATPSTQTVS